MAIREALWSEAGNTWTEPGIDLKVGCLDDEGDLWFNEREPGIDARGRIEDEPAADAEEREHHLRPGNGDQRHAHRHDERRRRRKERSDFRQHRIRVVQGEDRQEERAHEKHRHRGAFAIAQVLPGATGTLSASRVAYGLANSLGFELFTSSGAATFDLARAGEFGFIDPTPAGPTQGFRQVLVGPAHPYLTGGMPMDFPGVGYGQNDLFTFQARAFLEQVAGLEGLPRLASFEEGLHNLRLLDAVVASAKAGGADVAID